jgi:hypothetical protein
MIHPLIQLPVARFKLVARFKFSNKSLALGAWVIGSLLGFLSNEALAQVALDSALQTTASERWVGWLETKSQNLRLIVSLSSSAMGSPTGSVTSPDQSETSVPISNASIDDQRQLSFQVAPEGIGSAAYAFEGSFQGDKLSGILEQSRSKPKTARDSEPTRFGQVPSRPGLEKSHFDSASMTRLPLRPATNLGCSLTPYSRKPMVFP